MADYYINAGGNLSVANTISLTPAGPGTHTLSDLTTVDRLYLTSAFLPASAPVISIALNIDTLESQAGTSALGMSVNQPIVLNHLACAATDAAGITLQACTINSTITSERQGGLRHGGNVTYNSVTGTSVSDIQNSVEWYSDVNINGTCVLANRTEIAGATIKIPTAADSLSLTSSNPSGVTSASVIENEGTFNARLNGNNDLTVSGGGAFQSNGDTWNGVRLIFLDAAFNGDDVAWLLNRSASVTLPATISLASWTSTAGAFDFATNNADLTVYGNGYFGVTPTTNATTVIKARGSNNATFTTINTAVFPSLDITKTGAPLVTFSGATAFRGTDVTINAGGSLGMTSNGFPFIATGDVDFGSVPMNASWNNAPVTIGGDANWDGQILNGQTISVTGTGTATAATSFENVDATGGTTIQAIGATNVDGNTNGGTGIATGPAPDNNNIQFAAAVTARSRAPLGVF